MGQYWLVVNLDKQEFIHPHALGAGMKLLEQLHTWPGTSTALLMLCAAMPEARGGGDPEPHSIIGRWAGNRIAVVGDYTEDNDLPAQFKASTIYHKCLPKGDGKGEWTNISELVCDAMERTLEGKFMGREPGGFGKKTVPRGEGWREWKEGV